MTALPPVLPPRLDQFAHLVALDWDIAALAAETGLLPRSVRSQLAKLRRALGLPVGRSVFLPPATYAQVLVHWAARYVRCHPLAPGQACLHCASVPVVRAAHETAWDWERRRCIRFCRGCWTRFREARWRP